MDRRKYQKGLEVRQKHSRFGIQFLGKMKLLLLGLIFLGPLNWFSLMGQNKGVKFIGIHQDKQGFTIDSPTNNLRSIKKAIINHNPTLDTLREEFPLFCSHLLSILNKPGNSISSKKIHLTYNLLISRYNSICQTNDFISDLDLFPTYKNQLKKYLLLEITDSGFIPTFPEYKKLIDQYKNELALLYTGSQTIEENNQYFSTTHNQLEKIIPEINPFFTKLPERKKLSFQQKIQQLNPWIGSFKKGITYNQTKLAFFIDDNLCMVIPKKI